MELNCDFSEINGFVLCTITEQRIDKVKKLKVIGTKYIIDSNHDVSKVLTKNCKMSKIPEDFPKLFPYLEYMEIHDSLELKMISKKDLAGYKHLKEICIKNCGIEFLPGDLFEGFENLRTISFEGCNLRLIEPNILDGLTKLVAVNFGNNYKINSDGNSHSVITQPQIINFKEMLTKKYNEFCIKHPSYVYKLRNNLGSTLANLLQQDKSFKDLKINIKDREFLVHKSVIAARSPTIAEMLKNNPEAKCLELIDIPVEVFEKILNFIYTDELPYEMEANFSQLFAAADRLKIEELKKYVTTILIAGRNSENALEMLKIGHKYGHEGIKMKAFEKIKEAHPIVEFKDEWIKDSDKIAKVIDYIEKVEKMQKEFLKLM